MKNIIRYLVFGIILGFFSVSPTPISGRDNPWLNINLQGNYEPGEEIVANVSGTNIKNVDLKLLRVDPFEVISADADSKDRSDDSKKLELKKAELIKEWTVKLKSRDGNDRWRNRDEKIKNPGAGAYILQASGEGLFIYRMFIVSGIAAVMKSSGTDALVFVADRRSGEAKSDAKVSLLLKDGSWKSVTTDDSGVAEFDGLSGLDYDSRTALIQWKNHYAAVNFYFFGFRGWEKYKTYVYTDRPVYRPGQKVNLRGIIRCPSGVSYSIPDEKKVKITIRDPRGNEMMSAETELTEFGSFSTNYSLGEDAPVGYYSVNTEIGDMKYHSNFEVEEYRKPEYEITVSPLTDIAVQGDPLMFTVNAKYYFGEPVKNAAVSYTIHRQEIWSDRWRPLKYSWYYDNPRISYRNYGGYGEEVASGGGHTDDNGEMEVSFSDTKFDRDARYTLVARVTDKGRREISGTGMVIVYRAGVRLSVRTDRYMSKPGEKTWITARSTDLRGNPVSAAVDMEINIVNWQNNNRVARTVLNKTLETSTDGEVRYEFVSDEPGYYEITVSARDDRENSVSESTTFHVASTGSYRYYYSGTGIDVVIDRDSYAPGDEVNMLINSQLGDAHALITIEADSIIEKKVVRLENGASLYSFKVTPEMQPNADIKITVIKDNQLNEASNTIVSPPEHRFLNVTIRSEKSTYKPGEKAEFEIIATDNDGNPARAELSLGVVDESIYAIRPDGTQDIRSFFYGRRRSKVRTDSSFWFRSYGRGEVMEMKSAGRMAAPEPAMEGIEFLAMAKDESMDGLGGGKLVQPEIRSYFPDTAYWQAHVVTDADGRAAAAFNMPDSLTTWRLTSRGVTLDTSVGQITHEVVTRKNIIIRLETPRFFTQGDELNLVAVVHNYLDTDKEVVAVLNAKGLKLLEGNEKQITVRAGGDARVEWRAMVEAPQDAWITAKALTDEESDAMQLTIPVLPHGSPGADTLSGEAAESEEFALMLPENFIPGTEKLSITVAPSLTAGMFDAFEYLAGYPYGCVEQTMSRFLPDVVIAEALQRAGRPLTGKLTELPDMIADGLERLADMQHSDGGWGWWKDDDNNPVMTAYVVFGLTQAKRADYAVPADMIDRGVGSLKQQYEKTEDLNSKAYMMFALSEAGAANKKAAKALFDKREKLTDYGRAALAIACAKLGLANEAETLVHELEKSAVNTKSTAYWEPKENNYRWTDNPVETTSFAVLALLESAPDNPLIVKAVRYLNMSRRGDRWYSTRDTAAALIAMTRYMSVAEDQRPDYEFIVTVNGRVAGSKRVTKDDLDGEGIKIDASDLITTGKNKITITKTGKGNLYYYASLNYFESADELKAQDNGIRVERWYSWDSEGKKVLKKETMLKPGDKIWSHVRVRGGRAYEYVMVENFLPSGFEVDNSEQPFRRYYYWANREVRDEKVVSFITYMWSDDYETSVLLRAEVPGTVSAMPCTAALMYFPEVTGRSAENTFTVAP